MKLLSTHQDIERVMPDDRYPLFYMSLQIARYVFARRFVEGKIVLDIGCGCGYGSSYLAKTSARVVAGDKSGAAIEAAKYYYKKDNVQFLLLDAQRLPFHDEAFDIVISLETIEHLEQCEEFLTECKRVLRKQGLFISSTPNKELSSLNPERALNPHHTREFDKDEFYNLLSKYFCPITLYGQSLIGRRNAGKRGQIISRLGLVNSILTHNLPGLVSAENFLASHLFPQYRLLKLMDINEHDFDKLVDEKTYPFLITADCQYLAHVLIAIAKRNE